MNGYPAHAKPKALHERPRALHAAPPTPKALHAAESPRRLWRFPIALSVALIVVLAVGGAAYGYFAASGSGTGTGSQAPITPVTVTAFTPTPTLLPRMTGSLYFTVHNPNAFPVTLTKLTSVTPTTPKSPAVCAAATYLEPAVSFPDTVSIAVGAGATVVRSLSTVVKLATDAPTTCQGTVFTVTLVFTGKIT